MPLMKQQHGSVVVGILLALTEVIMCQMCPDLIPGDHMSLSQTTGNAGETVLVSCDAGYKLDTNQLQKYIQCESSGVWNDTTVGTCSLKQCEELGNATTTTTSGNLFVGDTVTIECVSGYAFQVNLSAPVGSRLTQMIHARCQDDVNSIHGTWDNTWTCSPISCGPPPYVHELYVNITSGEFVGGMVEYVCSSGHANDDEGAPYTLTARCNESAFWETDLTGSGHAEDLQCETVYNYKGCSKMSCMTTTNHSMLHGDTIDTCLEFCHPGRHRYAALTDGECFCSDTLNETTCPMESDDLCTSLCDTYNPNATESPVPVFCGGPNNMASIYLVFEGRYIDVTISGLQWESSVFYYRSHTCIERCRAKGTTHAGRRGDSQCYCMNITNIDGVLIPIHSTGYADELRVYDTTRNLVYYETCGELFDSGIRQAGTYYVENPLRLEWCDFLDGTVCDDHWVGFHNSCYTSLSYDMMDFNSAREYCHMQDAELVTILTQEEMMFLNRFIDVFGYHEGGNKTYSWWLGMVDNRGSSMFMWLDGNIMSFSSFKEGRPSNSSLECATGYFDDWQEDVCDVPRNVMCKKEAGWSDCFSVTSFNSSATFHSDAMTLTLCIEVCKGQHASYALVKNDTCICTTSEVDGTPSSMKTDCSSPCLGHSLQYCGGISHYTYLKLEGRHLAHSCDDLQMIGLESNLYKLKSNDTPHLEVCPDPMCPFSWLSVGSHCYKASLAQETVQAAVEVCAKENAYLVTLETEEELNSLYERLSTIGIYSTTYQWRIGLDSLHLNMGLYKWSNGRTVNPDLWNSTVSGSHGRGVNVAFGSNNSTLMETKIPQNAFVCEKGIDFVGCYMGVNSTVGDGVDNYSYMTVDLCVETCRAESAHYAYINSTGCVCSNVLTDPAPGECTSVCSGHRVQVCGGDSGQMSVYNIIQYPPIGNNTCYDLFAAGITLSGDYMVNGSLTTCHFIDGTVCDNGYIGYQDNCYKVVKPVLGQSRADACRAENATQTSLTSTAEYEAILSYIKRIPMSSSSRLFSGITDGGYDLDVFISEDGLLVSKDLIDSEELYTLDLHDAQGYISFRLDKSITLDQDGGVVCKKNKYILGCYNKPPSIIPILENFNSMELTLCKQLCSSEGHNVTLIGKGFCACSSIPEIGSFTSATGISCEEPCAIHPDQYCGDGSVVWAHLTGGGEVANNCTSLYKSGVFYNTTYYVLANSSNPGIVMKEQCGFTDTTHCPPTWFGRDGECYRFNTKTVDYQTAVTNCLVMDGYLFNPTNTLQPAIFDDVITQSGLFGCSAYWHTGIVPVFFNATYVGSNGDVIDVDLSSTINKPVTAATYDIDTKAWVQSGANLRYACQKNQAYLGCNSVLSVADVEYESDMNSMTMCVQWCYGQDMQYAATHGRICSCYLQLPSMIEASGHCTEGCDGVVSQPCGGIMQNGTELSNVRKIANDTALLPSCMDLLYHGITEPGTYYIRHDVTSPRVNVSCFIDGSTHAMLTGDAIGTISGSSSQSGREFSDLSFRFPRTSAWMPATDDVNQFVKLTLYSTFIVTGILTMGFQSSSVLIYVHTYTVMYRETQTGEVLTYQQNGTTQLQPGCNEHLGVCLIYLTRPFVTDEVILKPVSWHQSIAMQMTLYGQNFSEYQPFDQYSGCYLDYEPDYVSANTTLDRSGCIAHCRDNEYPFASVDETSTCMCLSRGVENGQLHDDGCGSNTVGQYRYSQNNSWAIYNTYDVLCPDPNITQLIHGNVSNMIFPNTDGVFTFSSSVNFTCNEGYEFTDGSGSDFIHCLDNNTWTSVTKTCQMKVMGKRRTKDPKRGVLVLCLPNTDKKISVISCASFTVDQGYVNFTSLEFEGIANVTCNPGLWTESMSEQMAVKCEANKQWTIIPTCTVHNRRSHQLYYQVTMNTFRTTSTLLEEVTSRSRVSCASLCTENYLCRAANYQMSNGPNQVGSCRLFSAAADGMDLINEQGWVYLEL